MKKLLLYASAPVLAGLLIFCKNNSTSFENNSASTALPAERIDSLFGIKGCDRAGFKAISSTEHEFIYQDFTVHITPKAEGGEDIRIFRTDTMGLQFDIIHEAPTYFRGASHGQVLLDEGTGPDNRKLVVYHVKRHALMIRWPYCGDDMEITQSGNVRFLTPIAESEVTKMPECPEKADWEKKGLRVGYGQRCLFSLINRSITKKSEFECVPLQ